MNAKLEPDSYKTLQGQEKGTESSNIWYSRHRAQILTSLSWSETSEATEIA